MVRTTGMPCSCWYSFQMWVRVDKLAPHHSGVWFLQRSWWPPSNFRWSHSCGSWPICGESERFFWPVGGVSASSQRRSGWMSEPVPLTLISLVIRGSSWVATDGSQIGWTPTFLGAWTIDLHSGWHFLTDIWYQRKFSRLSRPPLFCFTESGSVWRTRGFSTVKTVNVAPQRESLNFSVMAHFIPGSSNLKELKFWSLHLVYTRLWHVCYHQLLATL